MATEVRVGGYTQPKPASPAVEAITTLVSQVLTSSIFGITLRVVGNVLCNCSPGLTICLAIHLSTTYPHTYIYPSIGYIYLSVCMCIYQCATPFFQPSQMRPLVEQQLGKTFEMFKAVTTQGVQSLFC